MADWVHCNTCFHQPGDGRKFFLTNCGHMYCETCVKEGTRNKCMMCGNPCSSIALSSQMKPDVEIFFKDPADIIKKQQSQLNQVMDFQKNHRQRLITHMKEKNNKQKALIEEARKKTEQWEDLEREILILKEENANLRRLLGGGSPGNKLASREVLILKEENANLRRLLGGSPGNKSANRAPPGRIHSPAHQNHPAKTPPLKHGHSSPYNLSRGSHPNTPQNGSGDAGASQYDQTCTPKGPGRITMRTPPVDGKMGTPPTPLMGGTSLQKTPTGHAVRQSNVTPGRHEMYTPNRLSYKTSPMSVSPASQGTNQSSGFRTPTNSQNVTPTQQGFSTPLSQSGHWDPSRRQIHLSYQPRRPVLSASLSDPHRA